MFACINFSTILAGIMIFATGFLYFMDWLGPSVSFDTLVAGGVGGERVDFSQPACFLTSFFVVICYTSALTNHII